MSTIKDAIVEIVLKVLRFFFTKSRMNDAAGPGKLEEDLRAKARRDGWKMLGILMACFVFSGCAIFTRTVYVPDGQTVRLRKTVKNWPIWVIDKNGSPVEGRMDLPEGWYAMPLTEGD